MFFIFSYMRPEKEGYTGKFVDNGAQTAMILRDIAEKYSMFIKGKGGGRADSALTTGMTNWEECPELAIIYDRGLRRIRSHGFLKNARQAEFFKASGLHILDLDLIEEDSFDSAVNGCICVFHAASPVLFTVVAEEATCCSLDNHYTFTR
ncbi:cation/hydrogen exchanger family protein [Artemisia annua]|uniref:Cation/hydrogen exchanger family protein n=1 Tax=Artemisia annua TaxID=35608 RepID=A0A2U1MHE8_ARTAN|nr:cation/hydrogen exchanger family protein [Artemisia annua]